MLKNHSNAPSFVELSKLSWIFSQRLHYPISLWTLSNTVFPFFQNSWNLTITQINWVISTLAPLARHSVVIRGAKSRTTKNKPSLRRFRSVIRNSFNRLDVRIKRGAFPSHTQHVFFMKYRDAFLVPDIGLHTPRRRVNAPRHFMLSSSRWKRTRVPKFSRQVRARRNAVYRTHLRLAKFSWFIALLQLKKNQGELTSLGKQLSPWLERRFLKGYFPKKFKSREVFFFPKQDLFLNSRRTMGSEATYKPLFIYIVTKLIRTHLKKKRRRRQVLKVQSKMNGVLRLQKASRFSKTIAHKRQLTFNVNVLLNSSAAPFTHQAMPNRDGRIKSQTHDQRKRLRRRLKRKNIVLDSELKRQWSNFYLNLRLKLRSRKMSTNYGGLGATYQSSHRHLKRRMRWVNVPRFKGSRLVQRYRSRTMLPLFRLLNTQTRLTLARTFDSPDRNVLTQAGHSSLARFARNNRSGAYNLLRQLVKPRTTSRSKTRKPLFNLAVFQYQQLRFPKKIKRRARKKNKVRKQVKRRSSFRRRLNKKFVFARLTKPSIGTKTRSILKVTLPKGRRRRTRTPYRKIRLAFHVRRLRRLFSRTLRYRRLLRKCMPRIARIKRLRLQSDLMTLRNSSYLLTDRSLGFHPQKNNAPRIFNTEPLLRVIKTKPKRLTRLTRLFRTFRVRRPKHRFKRKKLIGFRRRRVSLHLRRKKRKVLTKVRTKFNFFAKRFRRTRISTKPGYRFGNELDLTMSSSTHTLTPSLHPANKSNWEVSCSDWSLQAFVPTLTSDPTGFKSKGYFKTLRHFINRQRVRLSNLISTSGGMTCERANRSPLSSYVRFANMRKSLTLETLQFEKSSGLGTSPNQIHTLFSHSQLASRLVKSHGYRFPRKANLLVRPILKSANQTPFIGTSVGFLFLKADALYRRRINKTSINKHRYSFFYSMDVKRSILRSKRAYTSSALGGSVDKSANKQPHYLIKSSDAGSEAPSCLLTIGSLQRTFTARSLFTYERSSDLFYRREVALKRIKFKPGYSRIWRRARTSLKTSLRINARYQYKLTRHLVRMSRLSRNTQIFIKELSLQNVLLNSDFVFDVNSANALLNNNSVYLNGVSVRNPFLTLFQGDFLQLIVHLKYYIALKWLSNWNKFKRSRLARLSYAKFRKSSNSQHKQRSVNFPNWILTTRVKTKDIPSYLEVDFFTLSSFVVYEPFMVSELTTNNFDEDRTEIFNLYNWKYIN